MTNDWQICPASLPLVPFSHKKTHQALLCPMRNIHPIINGAEQNAPLAQAAGQSRIARLRQG